MSNMEEKLWEYIDGTCTTAEQANISALIASDPVYREKYEELLAFNQEMAGIELDEPSMGFTYKVMEGVKAQAVAAPLKSGINKNIVRGLVGVFGVIILSLIVYAFFSINWATGNSGQFSSFALPEVKMPTLGKPASHFMLQALLFALTVSLLFLGDMYLRRQRSAKEL